MGAFYSTSHINTFFCLNIYGCLVIFSEKNIQFLSSVELILVLFVSTLNNVVLEVLYDNSLFRNVYICTFDEFVKL